MSGLGQEIRSCAVASMTGILVSHCAIAELHLPLQRELGQVSKDHRLGAGRGRIYSGGDKQAAQGAHQLRIPLTEMIEPICKQIIHSAHIWKLELDAKLCD